MRLQKVHRGHRFREKAILTIMRLMAGHAPGVLRTLFYRKEFFGQRFSELTQQVMQLTKIISESVKKLPTALSVKGGAVGG